MAAGLFFPSSLFSPTETPLVAEQTEINGANLQLSDGERRQHQQTSFRWTVNRFNQWVDVDVKMFRLLCPFESFGEKG